MISDRDRPDPRTPHPIATASDLGIHNPVKFPPAISDEDRKLAEETFDFIERSEASGNSYEANLPIGEPEPEYCGCCGGDAFAPPKGEHGGCCRDLHDSIDVSMALAEHTATDQGVCSMCAKRKDRLNGNGVCAECMQACQDLAGPCTLPASTGHPHPACTLAEHTASAIDKILGA